MPIELTLDVVSTYCIVDVFDCKVGVGVQSDVCEAGWGVIRGMCEK